MAAERGAPPHLDQLWAVAAEVGKVGAGVKVVTELVEGWRAVGGWLLE